MKSICSSPHCTKITGLATQGIGLLHRVANILNPVVWIAARGIIAYAFFVAGLVKIADMDSTMTLFEYEYAVPLLPVWFAAYSATFFELVMPVLIVLGLGTRLAVLPLIVMTAVIQFTYLSHTDHMYWAILLGLLFVHGPGKWSIDHWISQKRDG